MPVVWTDQHRSHEPGGEVWVGVRTAGTEVPARADAIRAALESAGARLVDAEPHSDEPLLDVHSEELVAFLRGAWAAWATAGLPDDPGADRVVPYVFPHPGLLAGLPVREPAAVWARPGAYCFDTMTLVGPGTWEAARAAVDAALTAVDLVAGGAPAAYACCRPPGHHVTRTAYGGSCYLNNAAVAAQALRDGGATRVAVLDVDAHHGNGAQAIFSSRDDVRTASVHVDPAAGWFPHYVGFADESDDSNLNVPLAPGSGDAAWLAAVQELAAFAQADALVVALGVDAAATDPESPLRVSGSGFRIAGQILGGLALPTVLVQEGGYDLASIGELVREVLVGFEEGMGSGRE